MIERECGQDFETLGRRIDSLPHFSPDDERKFLKVSFGEQILSTVDLDRNKVSPRLPNIEITGMPRTGKSTLISENGKLFDSLNIPYHYIQERNVPFDKEASQLHYNLHIFMSAADKLVSLVLGNQKQGVVLIDRGIYNPLAFVDVYVGQNEIAKKDAETFEKFVNYFYGGFIDAIIIFNSNSKNILERNPQGGRIINEEFLPPLEKAFRNLPSKIAHLRQDTLLAKEPLLITEIDANGKPEEYGSIFSKAIGSICKFYSGNDV